MILTRLFLLGQLACFWPVWYWYVQRMLDGSDEPWGILALATLLAIIIKKGRWNPPSQQTMLICSGIAALYALGYSFIPPLIRGILAVIAIAFSISSICYQRLLHLGTTGLLLLSLPLIASLQFYGGFPIRVITALISSQLLTLLGHQVTPQGTLLYWLGEVIAVDAPCAGIKMMWTALYLNFTLATWRNLGFITTWISSSFTLLTVFIGNILRATLLFFTESGLWAAPDFAHQAIGVLIFILISLAVLSFHQWFRKGEQLCSY